MGGYQEKHYKEEQGFMQTWEFLEIWSSPLPGIEMEIPLQMETSLIMCMLQKGNPYSTSRAFPVSVVS